MIAGPELFCHDMAAFNQPYPAFTFNIEYIVVYHVYPRPGCIDNAFGEVGLLLPVSVLCGDVPVPANTPG